MSAARNTAATGPSRYVGVNLLPEEIQQAENSASQRRMIVLLTLLVVAAVIAGTVGSFLFAQGAQNQLAASQAEAAQLLTLQAQYGGGQKVADEIRTVEDAQGISTAAEIDWSKVVTDVLAITPASITVTGFELAASTPINDAPLPNVPLEVSRIGAVKITGVTGSPGDVDAWVKAIEGLKGLSGATVVRFEGGNQFTIYYYVSDARLTNRFPLAGAPTSTDGTTPTPGATDAPTAGATDAPTPTPTSTNGQG